MSKRSRNRIAKRHTARHYLLEAQLHRSEAKKDVDDAFNRVMQADPREVNDIFADRVKLASDSATKAAWDGAPPRRFGPGYDDIRTQRATRHDDRIAKMLLSRSVVLEEGLTAGQLLDDIKKLSDDRPLIDRLHEATFKPPIGLQWIKDQYALRTTLRKAHCFTLDTETSALMVDFSFAIAPDLDGARLLAVPPFPTTWFQIDNKARLRRVVQLGAKLTASAASEDVIPKVGWLITTTGPNEYCMTYVGEVEQGMLIPPLSWHWTTDSPAGGRAVGNPGEQSKPLNDRLLFGMNETNIHVGDAWLFPASFQLERKIDGKTWLNENEMELMLEIAGELRHMFGLLVALGAGQLGAISSTSPQPLSQGPPVIAKGKTLFPIEHKILTIKLSKRHTVEKVTMRAITGIKHRWHEVRGHFRTKYNSDGTVKWRIPIKPHSRGDERLGRVEKTYKIQK